MPFSYVNTNFGSDAEQLITRMREALALERPERTQGPDPLNASLVAAFLANISVLHLPERERFDGHHVLNICDVLRPGQAMEDRHRDAQDREGNHQLAVVREAGSPAWVHGDGDRDLDIPLSVDEQRGRRPCAGGRPTAGGRLLLRPISQGACRKSRAHAGSVMISPATRWPLRASHI